MSESRQPLLFASGTFFTALLITVSIGVFSHFTYETTEQPIFQVQAAPYEACWQAVLPADESLQINHISLDGVPRDLNYPLSSIDQLITASSPLGYTITTQPYEQHYQLITIRGAPWGERTVGGTHGVSKFTPLVCDPS